MIEFSHGSLFNFSLAGPTKPRVPPVTTASGDRRRYPWSRGTPGVHACAFLFAWLALREVIFGRDERGATGPVVVVLLVDWHSNRDGSATLTFPRSPLANLPIPGPVPPSSSELSLISLKIISFSSTHFLFLLSYSCIVSVCFLLRLLLRLPDWYVLQDVRILVVSVPPLPSFLHVVDKSPRSKG